MHAIEMLVATVKWASRPPMSLTTQSEKYRERMFSEKTVLARS